MSEPRPEPTKLFLQRTWVRRSLLGFAAALLLLSVAILAVPLVVSSDWARTRVEQGLASATDKPASLRLLSFSWSDGLRVEGLRVGRGGLDDESFLCTLERLHVGIDILPALRRDLRLSVQLTGLRLRKRLAPPDKPPAAPLAIPLPTRLKDGLAALRQGLKATPRSGDAHVSMDLSDIAVRLILPASANALDQRQSDPSHVVEHQVDLRDVVLRLNVPGLASGPASLDAGFKVVLDGRELTPLKLQAKVEDMVDAAGLLAPAQARLTAEAEAPGLHLTSLGSVAKGFKTDLRLDLRQLTTLLKPFAGASLPESSGSMALGLTLAQPDPDHLDLGLVAFADSLRAAGGPLGAKAVGPLDMNMLQEARFDLKAGTARLPGKLRLLNKSTADWLGEVTGLNQGSPKISLNIRPLQLQLNELLSVTRGLLPPGLGIRAGTVDAEDIGFQATLPEKPGPDATRPHLEASVKGLIIKAEGITH
ncbi:MAG: hypothetical protein Q7I92_05625, partial [Humidesulfovibrio sp.]|nr:hypothetical protein [Humidesulfovibrio sp.]